MKQEARCSPSLGKELPSFPRLAPRIKSRSLQRWLVAHVTRTQSTFRLLPLLHPLWMQLVITQLNVLEVSTHLSDGNAMNSVFVTWPTPEMARGDSA